jgi:hypothetical protein
MPLTLQRFLDNPCSKSIGSIERTSENILTVHDVVSCGLLGLITNIDLFAGAITRTRKFFVFTWRKAYPVADYQEIEIQDKGRLMEGYRLPLFVVYLTGKGRRLRIYSTGDFKEAKAIQNELSDFLKTEIVSTSMQQ